MSTLSLSANRRTRFLRSGTGDVVAGGGPDPDPDPPTFGYVGSNFYSYVAGPVTTKTIDMSAVAGIQDGDLVLIGLSYALNVTVTNTAGRPITKRRGVTYATNQNTELWTCTYDSSNPTTTFTFSGDVYYVYVSAHVYAVASLGPNYAHATAGPYAGLVGPALTTTVNGAYALYLGSVQNGADAARFSDPQTELDDVVARGSAGLGNYGHHALMLENRPTAGAGSTVNIGRDGVPTANSSVIVFEVYETP